MICPLTLTAFQGIVRSSIKEVVTGLYLLHEEVNSSTFVRVRDKGKVKSRVCFNSLRYIFFHLKPVIICSETCIG